MAQIFEGLNTLWVVKMPLKHRELTGGLSQEPLQVIEPGSSRDAAESVSEASGSGT
jgi:hypothetical protein